MTDGGAGKNHPFCFNIIQQRKDKILACLINTAINYYIIVLSKKSGLAQDTNHCLGTFSGNIISKMTKIFKQQF